MMLEIFITILVSSLSLVILNQRKNLSEKYNFLDNPATESKKIHKYSISTIGGISRIKSSLISLIISFYLEDFFSKKYLIIMFTSSFLYFFLGRYDDIKNISPSVKFIFFVFIFLFFYPLETDLIIRELRFNYLDIIISLNDYSIFFTLFCMFVFYNASNFIDGVNGLYASIIIFWIISFILITKLFSIVLFIIVLSLLIFLYFNLRNKVFLEIQETRFYLVLSVHYIFLNIISLVISIVMRFYFCF